MTTATNPFTDRHAAVENEARTKYRSGSGWWTNCAVCEIAAYAVRPGVWKHKPVSPPRRRWMAEEWKEGTRKP